MISLKEVSSERQVYYSNIDFAQAKPVFTIYRFNIYKRRITHCLISNEFKEVVYLIVDINNPVEKCIVYCLLTETNQIAKIKYWRAVSMDKELCFLIVNAFITGYLNKKYILC